MSVTFWMEQAALERYQPEPVYDPEWWSQRPAAPFVEINLSNSNALTFARELDADLVHEDEDGVSVWGNWDMAKLDKIHAQLMVLINRPKRQEPMYFDPFVSKKPGQMAMYHGGRDEEYVERVLKRLLELVVVAREHGFPVTIG